MKTVKKFLPSELYDILAKDITDLRPAQAKAVSAGLLTGKNVLICTPTASGKTLIAELAAMKNIFENVGKAVYIVPLKALASEKYKDFSLRYSGKANIALSIGDMDKVDSHLGDYDVIVTTSEKMDSLLRHRVDWVRNIKTVIVDEVHLLNDHGRGPTLEILITLVRELIPHVQIVALSATIGNPLELARWLNAELVVDDWRPVKLEKGIYFDGEVKILD